MTQTPRTPDLAAQRAALQKLEFLLGKWSGDGRMFRSGEAVDFFQTERAEYQLDGLLLLIEGIGRSKPDGKLILQALGIISYDDEVEAYHMRAYNNGRYVETEVRLEASGKCLTWGFALGEIRTKSVLRLDEQGRWTERHEMIMGTQPARKFMELMVSREA